MRSNVLFVLGLVLISTVAATQTSFQSLLNTDSEYRTVVQKMKQANNMGSIILSMAEMTAEQGRFTALFDAIDNLSHFLVKDRAEENQSFKEATAQFHQDVARLTKQRDTAQALYTADNAQLKNKLYPDRLTLQQLISKLEKQLSGLEHDLKVLRSNRVQEIATFKQRSADYTSAISSCKRALPLLRALQNGQSFAELDADVFGQISTNLKQSLGKLEMGPLYNVFVEAMVQTLTQQNFVEQEQLKKVIDLIVNLQERLEQGLVALNNDEALNLKRFNETEHALEKAIASTQHQLVVNRERLVALNNDEALNLKRFNETEHALEKAIASTQHQLVVNRERLVELNSLIARTEKHRDEQEALYNQRVSDLELVNKNYVQRTNDHTQFIHEVDQEEATIAEAVRVLNKGGVTRSA